MIKRNGSTFRTLLIAIVLVALIYFIYLYNGVQSRLKNSEIMSEKLKRDRESLSSQLNEMSLEKENVREKYQKERLEIMSKLTDVQTKYKMLQSQHQDMETEYSRIQQRLDKFSEDSKLKDANRNQEFMQLKQEKEMEIVKLKDENANMFRENEQYKAEVLNLKQQLQQQQKNLMGNQMDTGGGGIGGGGGGPGGGNGLFMQRNMQQPLQQQQQQQQQFLDHPQQQQQPQQNGLLNDLHNGNVMGRILHQPQYNQFAAGQQQAQMGQAGNVPGVGGLQNGLPAKQVEQEQFQIPPANLDGLGNGKSNNGKDLVLQKQEVEQRKQQNENDHNQVQPPMNNEQLEKALNKTGVNMPARPVEAPNENKPQVVNDQHQNVLLAPAANEKANGLLSQDDKKNILVAPNRDVLKKQVMPIDNQNPKDIEFPAPGNAAAAAADNNENMRVHL